MERLREAALGHRFDAFFFSFKSKLLCFYVFLVFLASRFGSEGWFCKDFGRPKLVSGAGAGLRWHPGSGGHGATRSRAGLRGDTSCPCAVFA